MNLPAKILLCLLAALVAPLRAADLTTVLEPGWIKLDVEPRLDVVDLGRGLSQRLTQNQVTLPFIIHYGISQGIEGVLNVPFNWHPGAVLSGETSAALDRAVSVYGQGFGDVAVGIKFKLLEDTGRTPALFLESLLRLPTGSSSLEAFSRSLAGQEAGKGTGNGGLALCNSAILSAYADPFETYVLLSFESRGADDRNVGGLNEHVDYGSQTQALGGLEMDFGDRVTVAMETLAIITQASRWTENGRDILDGLGNSTEAFRLATLAQSGINLATTTEWYIGPIVKVRVWKGFSLSLRCEAGFTPDSKPWRLGLGFSGAFYPGINPLQWVSRKSGQGGKKPAGMESAGALSGSPEDLAPLPAVEGEQGNLQRYLHKHFKAAQAAWQAGKFKTLAGEVALMEDVGAAPEDLAAGLKEMQDQLAGLAEARCQDAAAAQKDGDLVKAVKAWRDALVYRPGWAKVDQAMKDNAAAIAEEARKLYLTGVDAYANGDTKQAVKIWNDALVLDPKNEKVLDSLNKAKGKLGAIQKLNKE